VTIEGRFRRIRLASKLWTGEPDQHAGDAVPAIHLTTEPRPLHFLVPG
jgi:hypothetical protein